MVSRLTHLRLLGRRIASAGGPLLIAMVGACGPHDSAPLVVVEAETQANTLDGCTACGCHVQGAIDPGGVSDWWFSFGLAEPGTQRGWQAVAAPTHCGRGSFANIAADFRRTVGTPYIVFDLSTGATVPASGDVDVETRLTLQKLTGFDPDGQPSYVTSVQERRIRFGTKGAITLPVLIPDPHERDSFGVYDVLLHLRTTVLGRDAPASYGSLSVTADMPGAKVLLNGGFAGRIKEGGPTLLENVRVGPREIRVVDFSGREARREVVVEQGRTTKVALELLGAEHSDGLLEAIGENSQGFAEYWRARDGAILVRIPGGDFLMGSREGGGRALDEQPQRRVHISEFLIDKTEVTWRQFRRFAEAEGVPLPRIPVSGAPDDYPISFSLWEEASAYCDWVGGRLPTEAEWEKAARGTDGREYPWGDEWDARRCNSISGGLHRPESVGSHSDCVSPYGVLDMPGSMWEWSADRYGEGYYADAPLRDPQGPAEGSLRVKRGGAWMSQPAWLRSAYRAKASPTSRNADHGFRCAQDPTE